MNTPRPFLGYGHLAGLLAIVAVGVVLRLPYLAERSLWYDEAASWRTASFPLPTMLQSNYRNVHPPLYYLLLKGWMGVFGDSVVALRALSVLFGALTIVGMYLFGSEVHADLRKDDPHESSAQRGMQREDSVFGLAVAALVAVSAFQVHAAIEVKMYALGTCLVAFSSWLLLRALRTGPRAKLWVAYALCTIALLYTHYFALFSVAAQFVFLGGYVAYAVLRRDWSQALALSRTLLCVLGSVILAYVPWCYCLAQQVQRIQESYWIPQLEPRSILDTFAQFFWPESSPAHRLEAVLLAGLAGVVSLLIARRARRSGALVLCLAILPMVFAFLVSHWTPIWMPRYFRFAQLFWLAGLALALWQLARGRGRVLLMALVIGNLAVAYFDFWDRLDVPRKTGVAGAIRQILAEDPDGRPIVVTDPRFYFPARRYVPPEVPIWLLQPSSPLPHYRGPALIVSEDLISWEELRPHLPQGVWFISSSSMPVEMRDGDKCKLTKSFTTENYYGTHTPIVVSLYICPGEEKDRK